MKQKQGLTEVCSNIAYQTFALPLNASKAFFFLFKNGYVCNSYNFPDVCGIYEDD